MSNLSPHTHTHTHNHGTSRYQKGRAGKYFLPCGRRFLGLTSESRPSRARPSSLIIRKFSTRTHSNRSLRWTTMRRIATSARALCTVSLTRQRTPTRRFRRKCEFFISCRWNSGRLFSTNHHATEMTRTSMNSLPSVTSSRAHRPHWALLRLRMAVRRSRTSVPTRTRQVLLTNRTRSSVSRPSKRLWMRSRSSIARSRSSSADTTARR